MYKGWILCSRWVIDNDVKILSRIWYAGDQYYECSYLLFFLSDK